MDDSVYSDGSILDIDEQAKSANKRNKTENRFAKELRWKVKHCVKIANNTTKTFTSFNFGEATSPSLLNQPLHDYVYKALIMMAQGVKLQVGGGADGSVQKNEVRGIIKLVNVWHAIGHRKEDPTILQDFIWTSMQFGASVKAVSGMAVLSNGINAILEYVDKVQYDSLCCLMEAMSKDNPMVKMMLSIDPLVMEGCAIMYNHQTPEHSDTKDPLPAWAVMITFGKFVVGGCDVIVIRGRLLPHEVEEWGLGQRISIAHFTHKSLWKQCGMTCPYDGVLFH
ncbi:hypothetical protein L208DRAFT_1382457 [Tricholoma matsutake]|nr:hypothetical protein L208DRAFT_1382457 [Tricholoma matsutake 945]